MIYRIKIKDLANTYAIFAFDTQSYGSATHSPSFYIMNNNNEIHGTQGSQHWQNGTASCFWGTEATGGYKIITRSAGFFSAGAYVESDYDYFYINTGNYQLSDLLTSSGYTNALKSNELEYEIVDSITWDYENYDDYLTYNVSGGYELSGLDDENASALSSDFDATCVGYIIYNNIYLDIVHLICLDGNLSVVDSNDHEWSLFYNGEYVEEWSGILVGELNGVSSAFYNKISSFELAQYYRNVKFNEPTYDAEAGTYTKIESSDTKKIDMVGNYFVYSKTGINIQYTFSANEGYKIDSITSNYGTISTNKVTITSLNDDAEINIECDFVGDDFKIILCNNTSERFVVGKETINSLEVIGNLVENTSIENPSIIFELSGVPVYNYCIISSFHRSYYITKTTNIGINLWRIDLKVDVLESFKYLPANLKGIVTRSSINYSTYADDNIQPLELKKKIYANVQSYYRKITDGTADGYCKNTFNTAKGTYTTKTISAKDYKYYDKWAYVLVIAQHNSFAGGTGISEISNYNEPTGFSDIDADTVSSSFLHICFNQYSDLKTFIGLLAQLNLSSYIANVYQVPFNLINTIRIDKNIWNDSGYEDIQINEDGLYNASTYKYIEIGTTKFYGLDSLSYQDTTKNFCVVSASNIAYVRACILKGDTSPYWHYTDIILMHNDKYEHYAEYKINIPFYGEISVDKFWLVSGTSVNYVLSLYYVFDLDTGKAKYMLLQKNTRKIISEDVVNLSQEIPFSYDDLGAYKNRLQLMENNQALEKQNLLTGMFSAGLATLLGGAFGGGLGLAGVGAGAGKMTSDINRWETINGNRDKGIKGNHEIEVDLLHTTASFNMGSGALRNYTDVRVWLTVYYYEPTKLLNLYKYGRPCNVFTENIMTDFITPAIANNDSYLFIAMSNTCIAQTFGTLEEQNEYIELLNAGIRINLSIFS